MQKMLAVGLARKEETQWKQWAITTRVRKRKAQFEQGPTIPKGRSEKKREKGTMFKYVVAEHNLKRSERKMKTRRFVILLVGLMVLAVMPGVALADHLAIPIPAPFAVPDLYASMNAGDIDGALSVFAEDAVVKSNLTKREWVGKEEIAALLESRIRDGREFQVLSHNTREGLNLTVEVSDDGIAWGRETIEAMFEGGMITELTTTGFRLLY